MFQRILKVWISGVILVLVAAACTPAAPVQDERLGNLESKVDTLMQLQIDLTSLRYQVNQLSGSQANGDELQAKVNDLQNRIDALAAQIGTIPSTGAANEPVDNPFDIALAQYIMDTAGFHKIAGTMSETKVIDPAYLTTVKQVKKVLSTTQWPASLTEQNKAFMVQLDNLAAALEAEKADEAVELANQVHGAQHAFTKAIDEWLSSEAANAQ